MPLPIPHTGEAQDAFVARCMSDETAMSDFPESDQRLAVCFHQWREEGKGQDVLGSLEIKAIGPLEVKDAEKGEVTAVVSTFNVVDRQGDVVLPGAVRDGAKVKLSHYSHSTPLYGEAPVGKGTIRVDGERAVLHGKFFLSTERGREAFHTMRELGNDTEWSVGFRRDVKTAELTKEWKAKGARRLIAGMDILEASPVFMGANPYTATVSVKCEGCGKPLEDEVSCSCETKKQEEEAEAKRLAEEQAQNEAAEAERQLAMKQAAEIAAEEFERFARTRKKYAL